MVVKVKRGNRHHSCSSVVYYMQRSQLDITVSTIHNIVNVSQS